MPCYRVTIDASNFLAELEGKVAKWGFFTIRTVEAPDPEMAESEAVQSLRDDESLRELVRNSANDPPVMDVIEIVQLEDFPSNLGQQPGRVWYEMSPQKWWQFWRR